MTKKDYELVAGTFAIFKDRVMTHREKVLICQLATSMANQMRAREHTFDIIRFMQACKLPKVEGFNC